MLSIQAVAQKPQRSRRREQDNGQGRGQRQKTGRGLKASSLAAAPLPTGDLLVSVSELPPRICNLNLKSVLGHMEPL